MIIRHSGSFFAFFRTRRHIIIEVIKMNEELNEEILINEKPKKKSDPKLSILLLQLTACLILGAAAVCLRFFSGEFYSEVRAKYISLFEDSTTVREVLSPVNRDSTSDISTVSEKLSSLTSDISDEENDTSGDSSTSDGSEHETSSQVSDAPPKDAGDNDSQNLAAASFNSLYLPCGGEISSQYGYRTNPVTGDYSMHDGMDIAAESGTPVCSALSGRVLTVGEDDGYGIYVVVEHTGGLKTLYAHLSSAQCIEGQRVTRGERIALVGSTGRSTGPHLHFEIITSGGTVDPEYLLSGLSLS